MPLTAGNFGIYTINLLSTAFNDAVKTDVVLECIGANNIIVVAVEDADSDAAGLINVSGDRFKFYGNIDVLGDDRVNDCKRETIVRSVVLDCSIARPAKDCHHSQQSICQDRPGRYAQIESQLAANQHPFLQCQSLLRWIVRNHLTPNTKRAPR